MVVETGITYAGIVGLEKSNLEAFIGEEALGLSKVDGSMVGGGVPVMMSQYHCYIPSIVKGKEPRTSWTKK
jgi:hypothetical protein